MNLVHVTRLVPIVVGFAPLAWGQTVEPARAVDATLAGDHAIGRWTGGHTGSERTWTIALPTERGHCYELLGAVSGASHVSLEVDVRATVASAPVPLVPGDVQRVRLCASLPGPVYTLLVRTDGATHWAAAMRESAAPPPSSSPSPMPLPPDGAGMAPPIVVGGPESDYVANQIRRVAQGQPWRPMVAAQRWTIDTNQSQEVPLALVGGHCVTVVAAGMPTITDVDLALNDPAGNRVAQDDGHRGIESMHHCPSYSGTYRLTVHVFAGRGPVGVQVFEEH